MPPNWSNYSLEQLRKARIGTFREGGGTRPDVLLVEINGSRAVLKDQNGASKWFARLVGPMLNYRETKALEKLSSLKAVPNLLHRPCARSFLMEYRESEQISHLKTIQPDWPEFFDKLKGNVVQMHMLGVAHNDLRNPSNTLITPSGDPVLVDLVASFFLGSKWNFLNRWAFNKFALVDLSAITKLKTRYAPQLLDGDEIHPQEIAGRTGFAFKQVGQWIRRLSQRWFTND